MLLLDEGTPTHPPTHAYTHPSAHPPAHPPSVCLPFLVHFTYIRVFVDCFSNSCLYFTFFLLSPSFSFLSSFFYFTCLYFSFLFSLIFCAHGTRFEVTSIFLCKRYVLVSGINYLFNVNITFNSFNFIYHFYLSIYLFFFFFLFRPQFYERFAESCLKLFVFRA